MKSIGRRTVIMMDNARIHVSRENMSWYAMRDIKIIRNIPYRPDLMGIEVFWRLLKLKYRAWVTARLATGQFWDQQRLLTWFMHEIPDEAAKKCARDGIQNLMKAAPVDPNRVQMRYLSVEELPFSKGFKELVWGKEQENE